MGSGTTSEAHGLGSMWGTENGEADARRELEFAAFAPLSTFVPLSDTSVMGSVSEGDVDDVPPGAGVQGGNTKRTRHLRRRQCP